MSACTCRKQNKQLKRASSQSSPFILVVSQLSRSRSTVEGSRWNVEIGVFVCARYNNTCDESVDEKFTILQAGIREVVRLLSSESGTPAAAVTDGRTPMHLHACTFGGLHHVCLTFNESEHLLSSGDISLPSVYVATRLFDRV